MIDTIFITLVFLIKFLNKGAKRDKIKLAKYIAI